MLFIDSLTHDTTQLYVEGLVISYFKKEPRDCGDKKIDGQILISSNLVALCLNLEAFFLS